MTIEISDQNPRSIKAVQIAAGAGQWLKCRTADGVKAYGIASSCQPGRFYLVTAERCDCQDAQRHPGLACKHILAVRLHVALVKGARHAQPAPRPRFVASHTTPAGQTVYLPRREPVVDAFKHFEGD